MVFKSRDTGLITGLMGN